MGFSTPRLSVVVPTRNEAATVESNLRMLTEFLQKSGLDSEIVVADYSTDATPAIVSSLRLPLPLRLVRVDRPGIGAGLREGFAAASGDLAVFYPADLSWNFDSIPRAFKAISAGRADVVVGSRGVPGAAASRSLSRRAFSLAYRLLARLLLGLRVRDPQGTVMLRTDHLRPILARSSADDAFFQTELLVLAERDGRRILELPCLVRETRSTSNIQPFREGARMFRSMLRFRRRLKRLRHPAETAGKAPAKGGGA